MANLYDASVHSSSPTQNNVAADTKNNEECAHDDQVHIKLCIFDIEFFDHIRWLLEYAQLHLLLYVVRLVFAVEWVSVVAVNRLNHSLECIPTNKHSATLPL